MVPVMVYLCTVCLSAVYLTSAADFSGGQQPYFEGPKNEGPLTTVCRRFLGLPTDRAERACVFLFSDDF